MPTEWFYPHTVIQYPETESHIAWDDTGNFSALRNTETFFVGTKTPLLHIANPTMNDLKMKTYYLFLKEFNINSLPNIITGLEVEMFLKRGGRITDETVQLMFNDEFIGNNKADFNLDQIKTFGSEMDTWGLSEISSDMLQDNSFGIGLRLQSHPNWPHKETPMLKYIRLRVY